MIVRSPKATRERPPAAVLLDAFGTLVTLEPPVPLLRAALAEHGYHHGEAEVAAALATEVAHYRTHHLRGRDAAGLRALRLECAAVLGAALGGDGPAPSLLAELLLDSLRFALVPEAVATLEHLSAAGLRLAVVSNWDSDLPRVLTQLGVADAFDAIVVSARCGFAKPDPRLFRCALARLGVATERAVHCGDDAVADGAAGVLGMRVALIEPRLGAPVAGAVVPARPWRLPRLGALTASGILDGLVAP